MDKLDALAAHANVDLDACSEAARDGSQASIVSAYALVAIASQQAYSNAVAAARFYMEQELWTIRGEHK